MTVKYFLGYVLGQNIRTLRFQRDLTQAQLAEAADISTTHLNNIENGKSWVSCETAIALSKALSVDISLLFTDTSKNPSENTINLLTQKEKIRRKFQNDIENLSSEFNHFLDSLPYYQNYNLNHQKEDAIPAKKIADKDNK